MAINKVVYDGKTLIDLTDSTVSTTSLAEGATAYNASGMKVTGTMPTSVVLYNEAQNLTEAQKEQARENIGAANVEDVFESTEQAKFTNIFDTVAIEYGKVITSEGVVIDTTANLATTDFIPIKTGDVIRMADFALYATGSSRIGVYNSSKAFMASSTAGVITDTAYYLQFPVKDGDGNVTQFTVSKPSAGYIRICTNTSVIGSNPVLTINEEIAYEVGYGTKLNPQIKVDNSQIINAPTKNCWSILPNEHLNICYSNINRKPINTIEHFIDAATNFGYNALKCDVRPTSDGELVCCHDTGFTFDGNGYITTYDSSNQTAIHNVTAETVLGYSFKTGEHPCLVGDYLDVCRKYGKVAFITIRNEYMDVVIPKLLEELRIHNMTHSAIINCMTYNSLVQWRELDKSVMINYTLNFGVAIDQTQIDRAVGLGYCSLCGFSLSSSAAAPSADCDFEYARANGIRLLEAIAYHKESPETCYDMGYDGCQIGFAWNPVDVPVDAYTKAETEALISNAIGNAIGGSY